MTTKLNMVHSALIVAILTLTPAPLLMAENESTIIEVGNGWSEAPTSDLIDMDNITPLASAEQELPVDQAAISISQAELDQLMAIDPDGTRSELRFLNEHIVSTTE